MRMQGRAVWEFIVFVLNAVLFVLIGLQLPSVVDGVSQIDAATLAGYALATVAVVVGAASCGCSRSPTCSGRSTAARARSRGGSAPPR